MHRGGRYAEMGSRSPYLGTTNNDQQPDRKGEGQRKMETTQSLMKQAAETIEILGEELQRARDLATESMQELTQELDRARALAVKLEGAGLYLTEDEVLALARKLDGKPVQSETEDIALLTATNTIQARAQDIVYSQMSRRRQEHGKDD